MPRDSAAADRPASYLVGTAAAFPLFFRDRTKPINQLSFSPSAKFPKSGSSCESRAKRITMLARQAGAEILVHISGIGADAGSASPYIRSRGEGEAAVLDSFPSAKLVRPAVMFGPGDAFLTPLLAMLRRTPVFPMFGSGSTR